MMDTSDVEAPLLLHKAEDSPRIIVRSRSRTSTSRTPLKDPNNTPTKILIDSVADLELGSPSKNRKRIRAEITETTKEDVENKVDELGAIKTPKKKRKVTVGEVGRTSSTSDLVSKIFQRTASFTRTLRGSGKSSSKKIFTNSSSNPSIDLKAGGNEMDVDAPRPSHSASSIPARAATSSFSSMASPSASTSIFHSTEVVSAVGTTPQKPKRLHRGNELSELKASYSCTTLPRSVRSNRMSLFTRPNAPSFASMIKTEVGWINETGSSKVTSMDLSTSTGMTYSMEMDIACMDESQKGIESDAWYATYFKSAEHFNFLAVEDSHGPVSISVMRDGDLVRAIVRTEKVQDKLAVPASVLLKGSGSLGKKDKRGLLKSIVPPGWHLKSVREVKETKHIDELAMFETNELQTKFKWGVLYAKHGQTKEDQMFANNETSEHFKEFLSTLGETITLNGWAGYTGGLDTNKNMTGTESVFTTFHDHQIMFHVAPMLPHDPECPQQLERKRHLGNDVVVIVFMDNDNLSGLSANDPEAYLPTTIRTHFQHVLAVVQRDPTASTPGKPRYRLHISRKSDVPPFGPELPSPSLFDKTQLRNVLLSKLINGERAALKAPAFERAISRTRSGFIQYYHQEYTKK